MRAGIILAGLIGVSLVTATPSDAGTTYATYEGKDSITEGQGGTKVTADGVDFWTTGTPPHRYQILGILTDTRGMGLLSGEAIGNGGLAKRVKELGGSAVVVLGRDTQIKGAMVIGGNVGLARRATTQMLVVKYLTDPEPTHP